jgi:hypothetical protein
MVATNEDGVRVESVKQHTMALMVVNRFGGIDQIFEGVLRWKSSRAEPQAIGKNSLHERQDDVQNAFPNPAGMGNE